MNQVKKKESKAKKEVCPGMNQPDIVLPSNNDFDSTASPDCFLVEQSSKGKMRKSTLLPTIPKAKNKVCLGMNQPEVHLPSNNDFDSSTKGKTDFPKLKRTNLRARMVETKLKKKNFNNGQVIDIEDLIENDVM